MLVSRRTTLLALAALTLTGCSRGNFDNGAALSGVTDAVKAASARVTSVTESGWRVNGLGHTFFMTIRVDKVAPMSVEDLDAILEAIWLNAPGEPNTIELMAFADAREEKPVDLRTAAAKLTPASFQPSGQGGIAMISLWKRYGKWKNPA